MIKYLPESETFVPARRVTREAANAGREAVAALFRRGLWRTTLAFWSTTFLGLVLVFGLNTWLPQIMREAGYPLGAALGLLLTLNVGAMAGLIVSGAIADLAGMRALLIRWFTGAAVFLALLSIRLPEFGIYVVVFFAGFLVFSAQALVYAYTQRVYSDRARATGLGWTAGVGRIGAICGPLLGGALLSAGVAYPWGFYVFALVGALAAATVSMVRTPDGRPDKTVGLPATETLRSQRT